jgi:hypothetical protein
MALPRKGGRKPTLRDMSIHELARMRPARPRERDAEMRALLDDAAEDP